MTTKQPTTAEMVLSLRDWAGGRHELPDDAQLLTDVADRLEAAEATIKSIDTLLDNTWDTSSALLKGQSIHSKIKAIIKEHNDG